MCLRHMQVDMMLSTQHLEAGTITYMAPECFDLKGCVNEKCDIYALGIILWECITGEKPWKHHPNQYTIIYEVRAADAAGITGEAMLMYMIHNFPSTSSLHDLLGNLWANLDSLLHGHASLQTRSLLVQGA